VLRISYAGCFGLSPAISPQFTLEMLVVAQNREKLTKTLYFGSSRLFKVYDVDISKKLVVSACYDCIMSVPTCNHFHVRRANSGRITSFRRGASFSPPRSWGLLSPSGMNFCQEILETLSYYIMKTEVFIFTGFETVPGRDGRTDGQTDGQTDRITIANTRYSLLASSRA